MKSFLNEKQNRERIKMRAMPMVRTEYVSAAKKKRKRSHAEQYKFGCFLFVIASSPHILKMGQYEMLWIKTRKITENRCVFVCVCIAYWYRQCSVCAWAFLLFIWKSSENWIFNSEWNFKNVMCVMQCERERDGERALNWISLTNGSLSLFLFLVTIMWKK